MTVTSTLQNILIKCWVRMYKTHKLFAGQIFTRFELPSSGPPMLPASLHASARSVAEVRPACEAMVSCWPHSIKNTRNVTSPGDNCTVEKESAIYLLFYRTLFETTPLCCGYFCHFWQDMGDFRIDRFRVHHRLWSPPSTCTSFGDHKTIFPWFKWRTRSHYMPHKWPKLSACQEPCWVTWKRKDQLFSKPIN